MEGKEVVKGQESERAFDQGMRATARGGWFVCVRLPCPYKMVTRAISPTSVANFLGSPPVA